MAWAIASGATKINTMEIGKTAKSSAKVSTPGPTVKHTKATG